MGTDQMSRRDVVKKLWDVVRERGLQDPTNKQFAICDDQLLKVFGEFFFRLRNVVSNFYQSMVCLHLFVFLLSWKTSVII